MEKRIEELRRLMNQAARDGVLAPEAASELAPVIKALKRVGFRLIDEELARGQDGLSTIEHPERPDTSVERDRRSAETWEELKALKFVLKRLVDEQRDAAPF